MLMALGYSFDVHKTRSWIWNLHLLKILLLARSLSAKDASTINFASILHSIEQGEGRELRSPRRDTTNISPRLSVVGVIPLPWVEMRYLRCQVRDVSKGFESQHPDGNVVAELLHLFCDIK